jgi:predicted dTDP-4-dehydrorhamnose reductase
MMKLALVGASSSIGKRLTPYLASQFCGDIIQTCYANSVDGAEQLDIRNKGDLSRFIKKYSPETIIWLAGTKNVKKCQEQFDFAYELNTQPIINLCSLLRGAQSKPHIIFISTDYVFDGRTGYYTEASMPNPTTNYGKSNYIAECELCSSSLPWTIIRTAAIVGNGFNYFDWLVKALSIGETVKSYMDSIFTPTPICLFNKAMKFIIENQKNNEIIHVVGNVPMSRYDFSLKVARILKRENQIIPIPKPVDNLLIQKNLSLYPSRIMDFLQDSTLETLLKEELCTDVTN